jgi:hypothetical protein
VVKGVKLVMCIAHDENTCHYMSGEFGGMASTQVEAKLCQGKKTGKKKKKWEGGLVGKKGQGNNRKKKIKLILFVYSLCWV